MLLYLEIADAVRTAERRRKESPLPVPDMAVLWVVVVGVDLLIGDRVLMERVGRQECSGWDESQDVVRPVLDDSVHSSAQKPAPRVGVSPIRPVSLLVMPPVLVATAQTPSSSRATAPHVPWGMNSRVS